MMVDWISARVPLTWDVPINNGMVVHYRADGSVEYGVDKTLYLQGSHDSRIAIRTVERGYMEFSGNPSKFMQGHNLFGTDDLVGLMNDVLEKICTSLNLEPSTEDKISWLYGDYTISRIDLTAMRELPTFTDVKSWILAASEAFTVKWRGRGFYQDGTLYFGKVAKGKEASSWQLKLYHKGEEILVRGHKLPENLLYRSELEEWASNKLRIELTLRSKELKRLGLVKVRHWTRDLIAQTYKAYVDKIDVGELSMCDVNAEQELKPKLQAVYALWKTGADLRKLYAKNTFYRYRSEIKNVMGVDISALCPKTNVIPLKRYLEPLPCGIPDFAKNTNLFYQPQNRVYVVG
ncbi:hypothetical protein HBA92_21570 [Ochrobactrum sp. MR28]|uniref:Replication-associated protein G2P n=1 Tax=Panagrolaimus sp. ES5 TaxID=591445 RepID=A0AC34FGB9_9BILA|nr:hypothetical protein [Ochrobactrum sp. MR28]MBX8818926.1 hypothetical protein [Ochrobactrum sp. MR31]